MILPNTSAAMMSVYIVNVRDLTNWDLSVWQAYLRNDITEETIQ